jgi:hypothetical protein
MPELLLQPSYPIPQARSDSVFSLELLIVGFLSLIEFQLLFLGLLFQ